MVYTFKVWLEREGKPLIGKGKADILEAIDRKGSITQAAKDLKMSYKHAWDCLAEMENILSQPVIRTRRGGFMGGGGAELTNVGRDLLKEYNRAEKFLSESLDNIDFWGKIDLKISARNRLEGIVQEVDIGVITAKIKIKIETPVIVTAIISKEAVEELDIKPEDKVEAVIKATEVMVAKRE